MAYCDKCGNYDESHRDSMDYEKDSHLEAQNYEPDLYYYWDSPLEEDMIGETLSQMLIVYAKSVLIFSTEKRKLNGNVKKCSL